MQDFIPGQRWISDAELQMGLGTVQACDHRTVTLLFVASGETRVYAKQSAPLTRVQFEAGDEISTQEGWTLRVESVRDADGLLTYVGRGEDGQPAELEEGQLNHNLQLNRPGDRLFSGQIDADKWFELRYRTRQLLTRLCHSDLHGLVGVRTSLIPHQLYIAHEVAKRYAPRVLLADEVGLGKTIEAGLILHQQLLTERAHRVLIVVPDSLLHQWLVEMLRRFNLRFSLFDEERCLAAEESTGLSNPFHSEQLVLCSLDFLTHHPERFAQAVAGEWDLLVVDEAHHLAWSPGHASVEYQQVEMLANHTRGVLLLTATPEQLGKESHFARLRLLDPDRFPSFAAFIEEEQSYEPVAHAIEALLTGQPLDADTALVLRSTLAEGDNETHLNTLMNPAASSEAHALARNALTEHLLDRHGTGRVLFRNTRAAIQGFPERQLLRYPLELPAAYADLLHALQSSAITDPQQLLSPELIYEAETSAKQQHWTAIDPRIDWLIEKLQQLRPHKVLVITHSAVTALAIGQTLQQRSGLHAAVFHEGLSIIERDRAAAYFADPDTGTQALICSEIGSEGRNFQFAHHLILFDLPLNPDLLEQRIGRLDRIGQQNTIQIHLPYLEGSAQAIMAEWYHRGLNAFEHTCPAGHAVFSEVEAALLEALHQIDDGLEDLPALVETTHQHHEALIEAMHRGRDRLLEYNSCRPGLAERLTERAQAHDEPRELIDYLEALFDCFDIDSEPHSDNSQIIRPSDQCTLPGLAHERMTVTADRQTALANEDVQYLSWEHPLVSGAIESVLSSEQGNTALTAMKYAGVRSGTLLLECLFVLEAPANNRLQSSRYLPPTTIRIIIDQQGRDHNDKLAHEQIEQQRQAVDTETATQVVKAYSDEIKGMLQQAEALAQQQAPALLETAQTHTRYTLENELNRLKALQRVNPNVRDSEILFFEQQLEAVSAALGNTKLRLDAQRVIVVT